jgi:hypothetical protein
MSTMASTPSPPSSILSRTAKVFRVSLDLASAYLHAGQEVAAEQLLSLVEFELPYWSGDSVLGHGIADAELHVLLGQVNASRLSLLCPRLCVIPATTSSST